MKTKILTISIIALLLIGTVSAIKAPYRSNTDGQLHFFDFEDNTDIDTQLDTFSEGGAKDIGKDRGTAEIVFENGDNNLAYYEFDTEEVTDTGVSVGRVGGIGDNQEDGDLDILYTDTSNNLKIYDTGDDSTGDLGFQASDPGEIIDLNGDGSVDYIYTDTNDNLVWYDSGNINTVDTGQDAFRLGGIGDIDNDGDTDIAYRESGTGNLAYYDFGSSSATTTSITADWVGAIGQIDGDGGKDILYTDSNNNLKYYDTGDGGITDTGVQSTSIGMELFQEYERPRVSSSTNRTAYDNSIKPSESIELLNNITADSTVQEVQLATRPDTRSNYINWTSGKYDSPQTFSASGDIQANFTYSNSTLPLETDVFWKIWIEEENPNLDGDTIYTSTQEDNQDTAFEIEENPLEVFSSDPEQQETNLGDPVPFQETPFVENPTEFTYTDAEVREEIINTTIASTIELSGPDGDVVGFNYNTSTSDVVWNVSEIESGEQLPYTAEYDIEALNVDTTIENVTTSQGLENRVTLNITNPNYIDLEDIDTFIDYPYPESIVDTDLFRITPTERTNIIDDPTYAVDKEDTNLDGVTDRINFLIPSIEAKGESGDNDVYELQGILGQPVRIYREDVITNKPVREVKRVNWRVGFAFENDNPFSTTVRRKVRVPAGADDFRVDGNVREPRFDSLGRYILLQERVPALSNQTTFLRYSTRSVATTTNRNPPDIFVAGENAEASIDFRVENLANKDLKNVTKLISIDYGENIQVRDRNKDTVIQGEDVVRDDFDVNIGELEDNQVRRFKVEYEIPTAEVDKIRDGESDEANNLTIYDIQTTSQEPLDQLYFKSNIDCADVEDVKVIKGNESADNRSLSNWECGKDPVGSTLVPLGSVNPNSEFRLGIEYREVDATIGIPNIEMFTLLGFAKWIAVLIIVFFGYEFIWRRRIKGDNAQNQRGINRNRGR